MGDLLGSLHRGNQKQIRESLGTIGGKADNIGGREAGCYRWYQSHSCAVRDVGANLIEDDESLWGVTVTILIYIDVDRRNLWFKSNVYAS